MVAHCLVYAQLHYLKLIKRFLEDLAQQKKVYLPEGFGKSTSCCRRGMLRAQLETVRGHLSPPWGPESTAK